MSQNETPLPSVYYSYSASAGGDIDYWEYYDEDGNTIVYGYQYHDELQRLTSREITVGADADIYETVYYTYSGSDEWIESATSDGVFFPASLTYTHDDLGRLTGVSGDVEAAYAHDAAGRIVDTGHAGAFTYDAAERLLSTELASYTYEPRGTRLTKTDAASCEITRYSFDGAERLRTVEIFDSEAATAPASSVTMTYDPLGRLTRIDEDGAVTGLTWLGPMLVGETDAVGNIIRTYLPGRTADDAAIVTEGGTVYYAVEDPQGSVYALVDSSGQIAAQYQYDPFGRVLSAAGDLAAQPRRFHGAYYIESLGALLFKGAVLRFGNRPVHQPGRRHLRHPLPSPIHVRQQRSDPVLRLLGQRPLRQTRHS